MWARRSAVFAIGALVLQSSFGPAPSHAASDERRDAAPTGGTRVLVTGTTVINAGLLPRIVHQATIATPPEPGSALQLASGALALLFRWRRAHAS